MLFFFYKYQTTTLKTNETYLTIILNKIQEKGRVALTCFEKSPIQCHRGRVAKRLMAMPNKKFDLKNL